MTRLDVTFKPVPEASVQAREPAAEMRVYESGACPGMVSVVLYEHLGSGFKGGTRLNRAQAIALCRDLDDFLDRTAPRFTVDTAGTVTDGEAPS